MRCAIAVASALAVSACQSGQLAESDPEAIRNRASSLQRAADSTTDELINQISSEAPEVTAPVGNQTR